MCQSTQESRLASLSSPLPGRAWAFAILLSLVVWSFWNTLGEAAMAWRGEQYSHGPIIPLIAVFLLWVRRFGGTFDWRPRTVAETGRLAVVLVLLTLAWIGRLISQRMAADTSPDNLFASIVATSGFNLLAAMFYATGLLAWAAFSADAMLSHSSAANKPDQGGGDTSPLKDQAVTDEPNNGPYARFFREHGAGLLLLALAVVLRLVCAYMGLDVPEMWTLPLAALAVALCTLGWRALRWCWPAAIVLLFAFPLPFTLERELLVPLQGLAARGGAYVLQTLGLEASTEGAHFIRLGEFQLGVVEQCSGLRMTTVFIALVFVYVVLVRLPKWQIPIILISAIPIALVVNILRITVTGSLYVYGKPELAQRVFHDWAGYLMPLVAVVLLLFLGTLLDNLFVRVEEQEVPLAQRLKAK
ncbi:MAG: exosortase/archaeosortase family protein [Thermogutta sp.]